MANRKKNESNEQEGANEARTPSDRGPVVTKVGNLCADPELRFGNASGKLYLRARLAVSTPVTPGDWTGEKRTMFYDVTAFTPLAEHVAESLTKGARAIVTGRAQERTWTADDGSEHIEKGILADAIGPDLRWATVKVTKAFPRNRSSGNAEPSDDSEDF
jgi:single-strand DNA-binding protein